MQKFDMTSRRTVLGGGLGLSLFAALPAWARDTAGNGASFRAGAGRAPVEFAATLFPVDGFAAQHDPLNVRVLVLESGTRRLAIVIVDLTSIFDGMITAIKAAVTKTTGIAAADTVVCASHGFSAPHVFTGDHMPPDLDPAANAAAFAAIETAALKAAQQAWASIRPARFGAGSGVSTVNVNRDVETPQGWWLGADDAGFADHHLGVLRIDGTDGKPIAIVMNFAVQSSVMDGSQRTEGGRVITADLAGAAARYVEGQYADTGTVALFLAGAAGDQAPFLQANRYVAGPDGTIAREDIHEAGFTLLALLGERLGGDVMRVARRIAATETPAIEVRRESLTVTSQTFSPRDRPTGPVQSLDYHTGGPVEVPIALLRIGDSVIVGVQPELAAIIGKTIRDASPFSQTLVSTMVDGAAKYMPDAGSYDRFTYEARSSPFAKGAAEETAARIGALLKQMKS